SLVGGTAERTELHHRVPPSDRPHRTAARLRQAQRRLLADGHCRDQLVERLAWALEEAADAEAADPPYAPSTFAQRRTARRANGRSHHNHTGRRDSHDRTGPPEPTAAEAVGGVWRSIDNRTPIEVVS